MERASGSGGGGSSDFVKKLYKMLEDPTYRHIVRWSDMGDSFIVLDNTEFTKNVLPRHFKHSNFASFVRQLNKYDFHKIRNTDEPGGSQYGEQAWEFKHPNFQMHNRDQLENIRRKAPAARKPAQKAVNEDPSVVQAAFAQIEELQGQLQRLKDSQKGIDHSLERNDTMCQALVAQVGNMHKKLMDYEDLIQRLIGQLAQKEVDLLRVKQMSGRNSSLRGFQIVDGNGYPERHASSTKGSGGEDRDGGRNGNIGEEEDEDAENDEDEYEDMEDELDEDMDDHEGEDGSANDEEHIHTSTTIPSHGLTPFIMDHSTPLGQNYDQIERDSSLSGPVTIEMDEILESRNWAIAPFDPGGVNGGNASEDQQSRTSFDVLLSKTTKESQNWLKLPTPKVQGQVKSSDGLSVVMSSPAATAPNSSATTPTGNIEESKTLGGSTVMINRRRYNCIEGNKGTIGTNSKPATSTSTLNTFTNENEQAIRDGAAAHGRTGFYLPPITEVGSISTGPGLLSQLKQTLDAANIDKGKGKETSGAASERRPPPPSRYHTAPILVVDDDPMCRRLLMLFFSYNKQEVDCASDGISAVEKVTNHKYSIIFMDVILPLLDGVSATRLMRKTDKETPIVCLASTTNEADLERYKRSGMNIILSKPFGFKKLYETMMKIMPESMGWAIPRGLSSKRNKGMKEPRIPIQEGSIEGQDNSSSTPESVPGQGGQARDTEGNNMRSKTNDVHTGERGLLQESGNGIRSVQSAAHGPFCLRPMAIANLINEKNYDPKKREHTDMEQPSGAEIVEKKRRMDLMPQNVVNDVPPIPDIETPAANIDLVQTVGDYGISLPLETPSPMPKEQRMQEYRSEHGVLRGPDKFHSRSSLGSITQQNMSASHQVMLNQSMITNAPPQTSFSFDLSTPSLQDSFTVSREHCATAIYPMGTDYMPTKMEPQDNSSLQLNAFPIHYQGTESEGLSMTMTGVPHSLISSQSAVSASVSGTQGNTNLASISYDEYRVD